MLVELCYVIYYVELNERQRGDPWSIRQTGIYQQIDFSTQQTTCVLLRPSDHVRQQLNEHLEISEELESACTDAALHFHFSILFSSMGNWHDYIQYIEAKLRQYVSRAIYFPVLRPHK